MQEILYDTIKLFNDCCLKKQAIIIREFSSEFKKDGQMSVKAFIEEINHKYDLKWQCDKIRKNFNMNNGQDENALDYLFKKFPDNKNPDEVYTKVVTLNSLYNAGLYNSENGKRISVKEMTKYITENYKTIDSSIQCPLETVDFLADKNKLYKNSTEEGENVYSFASKYMSFTYRNRENGIDKVPITDSYSRKVLRYMEIENRNYGEDYKKYFKAAEEVIGKYKKGSFKVGFKELDAFLWTIGKAFS